jgi:hypothetical protein
METKNLTQFQTIEKIIDALVINERGYLIICIKDYSFINFSDSELWGLTLEPKSQHREI